MNKPIGIYSAMGFCNPEYLSRYFLFFDKIHIPIDSLKILHGWHVSRDNKLMLNEYEISFFNFINECIKNDLVILHDVPVKLFKHKETSDFNLLDYLPPEFPEISQGEKSHEYYKTILKRYNRKIKDCLQIEYTSIEGLVRLTILIDYYKNLNTTPNDIFLVNPQINRTFGINENKETQPHKSSIFQLVIDKFPVISEIEQISKIKSFREDPDTLGLFYGLKDWINEIYRSDLDIKEINEKIEWLLYQYNKHIKIHKLKTVTGTLETFIISTAEFIEDLIKGKISKLIKPLFSARLNELKLEEKYLTAPGKELGYIIRARDEFQNNYENIKQ